MKIHKICVSLQRSFLDKVMSEGKFFLKGDLCSALILLGIVCKINDSTWLCGGDKSKHFHEAAELTCSSLTIS